MRAVWLTAGTLATVLALLLSTMLFWRGFARAEPPTDTTQRSIPFAKDKVLIEAGSGDVLLLIMPGRAGELLLDRALRWSVERPTVTEDWDERTGTLRLDATCPGSGQPAGPVCRAEYVVMVPPETDIEASVTRGDLGVGDLFGDVRLTSVSGSVMVRDVAGSVWARSGSGNVKAEGLRGGAADVEVGAGDVDLSFVNVPATVNAVVRTAGAVNVNVPRGAYDVTVDAARSRLDVRLDAGSPRKITARAPNGSVTICCR
ncbi:DUF4097 domain-containing protein [Nonomuraea zeae]|uniref:DUF4097 domain-containing protein n=1 Tax=Nonomuraea zeae TaxID=1642303 RepID=A0A5S4GG62_9ACTN|nr:DUF4097 domain-containing protein [Nonomuraea zeae]TMR31521.1 DUF4097 domain-containing protein [Nonomuraea zeae]